MLLRISARPRCAVTEQLDSILTADGFDAASIPWLSHRERFAVVCSCLCAELYRRNHIPHVIPILTERHNHALRPLRLALEFRAVRVDPNNTRHVFVDLDTLQSIVHGQNKRRALAAREALAALGIIDWSAASRRERAAYVLALVCAERLERAT